MELLRPKNFKLFMLVTLNAFIKGLGTFFRSVIWWFVPLHVLLFVAINYFDVWNYLFVGSPYTVKTLGPLGFSWYMMSVLLVIVYPVLFVCCLMVRPSVNRKTVSYFLSFCKLFFFMIPTVIVFVLGSSCVSFVIRMIHFSLGNSVLLLLLLFCFDIVLVPCMLFAMDSPGTCRDVVLSWWRGAKMVLYNLPIFVFIAFFISIVRVLVGLALAMILYSPFIGVLYVIGNSIDIVLHKLTFGYYSSHWFISLQAFNIEIYAVYFLVFLFSTSIISNIYIKKLYDNKDLYI